MRRVRWSIAALFAILFTACGGPDTGLGTGSSDNNGLSGPGGAVGQALAPYIVLSLEDGSTALRLDLDDIADARYRTTHMAFRRIQGLGTADYYLAVFETTQGQWKTLTLGAKPWTQIHAAILDPGVFDEDTRPAYNLSHSLVLSVINGFNLSSAAQLRLPTAQQWQFACAANSLSAWSWGNHLDLTTVSDFAAVYESQPALSRGPEPVSSRQPNAFGLFDMHGNVWEWTAAGTHVVGGSWHDSVQQARTVNLAGVDNPELDVSTTHALIGCRLVLLP